MKIGDIVLVKPVYKCKSFYAKIINIMDADKKIPYIVCPIINEDFSTDLDHTLPEVSFYEKEIFPTDITFEQIQKVLVFQ